MGKIEIDQTGIGSLLLDAVADLLRDRAQEILADPGDSEIAPEIRAAVLREEADRLVRERTQQHG